MLVFVLEMLVLGVVNLSDLFACVFFCTRFFFLLAANCRSAVLPFSDKESEESERGNGRALESFVVCVSDAVGVVCI